MDVWQLMPTRGMDGSTQKAELVCAVCNTPVAMVLNEAGTETGDLTAMRERKKVSGTRLWVEAADWDATAP
jgi:hypothetical protein